MIIANPKLQLYIMDANNWVVLCYYCQIEQFAQLIVEDEVEQLKLTDGEAIFVKGYVWIYPPILSFPVPVSDVRGQII